MIKRLEHIKETLMSCVQGQMGDLSTVDTKELGEVIDMIKDLSEAVYYCTIVESMNHKEKEPTMYYPRGQANEGGRNYRDMDREMGRMYYAGGGNYDGSSNGGGSQGNRSRNYPMYNYAVEVRDIREGRSPMTRKAYMENKEMHKGKELQLQELELYMQELGHDLTEMIEDASAEEKQMLQKKLSTLATKIV